MDRQQRENASDDLQAEVSDAGGSEHADDTGGQPPAVTPSPLGPWLTRRRAARLAGTLGALFLALIVIVGSIPAVRERAVSLVFPSATPTRAAPPRPTSTAIGSVTSPPTIPPGQGWVPAGPADAQRIAFSPSLPATAYTCGAPTLAVPNRSVPIAVDVSQDHGRTWQRRRTPALGAGCDLTVNPTDAQDIVLMTSPPPPFSGQSPLSLYRSFDGGQTWSRWTLPFATANETQAFTGYQWAWVSSTLFVAPYVVGDAGYIRLAASVAGRPFALVNQQGLFAGAPADATINTLLTTRTTLYVMLFSMSLEGTPQCCTRVLRTTDNGASWSLYAPTFRGRVVYLLQFVTNGDGISLFGQSVDATESNRVYLRSPDGGATWDPLPQVPGQLVALSVLASPNETIYADLYQCCGAPSSAALPGIYKLVPGETTWSYVAPEPTDAGGPIELAWDDAGQPLALWGGAHPPLSDQVQPGLETHTP